MQDFDSYSKEERKEQKRSEQAAAESDALARQLASALAGKGEADILRAIYREAERGRKAGTLTDAELDRFAAALPEGAQVVGRFMCQGQMPPAVRERYVKMAEQDPKRFEPMIENFDRALGHPDAADLTAFEVALRAAL